MQPADSFGYLLKRLRKGLDLTQVELAAKVGCTAAAIRKIEADERKPSLQLAELLANHLLIPAENRTTFLQLARHFQSSDALQVNSISLEPAKTKSDFPFPTNLPAPLTLLIDRKQELNRVVEMVASSSVRLLTLVGPPGIGKTRLSILCGRELIREFPDGVWFVDLSMISDPTLVIPAIGRVLSGSEVPQAITLQMLCSNLSEKQMLLILDNFEQVVEGAALAVVEILKASPKLKVLITSRISLFVYGEYEYPVPPLALPPKNAALNEQELMQSDAVCLFVMRLRQHDSGFKITPDNAKDVLEICTRMGGIPLALELAAAATRSIPITQLSTLLSDEKSRFWLEILKTKNRDLPIRQRTLSQAITWSYSLLPPAVQRVFLYLAVFERSFDARAVEAVCREPNAPELDASQVLDHLTDCYLLTREEESGQTRWFFLEVIREFAWETLQLDERFKLQERHAAYYDRHLAWYSETRPQAELARYFQLNVQNLNAALKWAVETQNAALAFHLADHLSWLWETQGYQAEGLALLPLILDMAGEIDPLIRISVLHSAANLAWMQQKFETASSWVQQAIQLAQNHQLHDQYLNLLLALGRIYLEQGQYEMASKKIDECLRGARANPDHMNPGFPLTLAGEVALAENRIVIARSLFSEAIDLLGNNSIPFLPMAQTGLAQVALEGNDFLLAWQMLRAAFPLAHLHIRRLRFLLLTLAGLLIREPGSLMERKVLAAELLGSVAGLGEKSGDQLSAFAQIEYQRDEQLIDQVLSITERQAARETGYRWTVDEATFNAETCLALRPTGN